MKYQILIFLLLLPASFTFAQNSIIFEVREAAGESVTGVNILVKGTTEGTVTDTEGKAILGNLPDGKVEIRISYLGFRGKEIILNFPEDNDKLIEVELEEDH